MKAIPRRTGSIAQANLHDFTGEYARSIADPEAFGVTGRSVTLVPTVDKGDGVGISGPSLVCRRPDQHYANALDRHADGPNRTKLALIWIGEDGSERKVTYYELRNLVSRFATGLKALGVNKGDTVVIYMPLTLGRRDRDAGLRPHWGHSFGRLCRHGRRRAA